MRIGHKDRVRPGGELGVETIREHAHLYNDIPITTFRTGLGIMRASPMPLSLAIRTFIRETSSIKRIEFADAVIPANVYKTAIICNSAWGNPHVEIHGLSNSAMSIRHGAGT